MSFSFTHSIRARRAAHQDKEKIAKATLDIEPRRFILSIPDYPTLDIDLKVSDAEIVKSSGGVTSASITDGDGTQASTKSSLVLGLKRQRPFDVHGATAEWFMGKDRLLVIAYRRYTFRSPTPLT